MDTYWGIPDNISSPPSALNIASSTNTSPIKITTSAAHNLETGMMVIVANHTLNTAANGLWTVTVVDADEFTLDGSVFNGTGGATGTVQSLDLGGFGIPEDGVDDVEASTFNVAYEAGGDRDTFVWADHFLDLRRGPVTLADATPTTVYLVSNTFLVPDVSANTQYRLPPLPLPAPFASRKFRMRFRRLLFASGFNVVLATSDGVTSIANLLSTQPGWVEVEASGSTYVCTGWGGDGNPLA